MAVISPILSQFSDALSALASGARGFTAGVRTESGQYLSGVLWKPNAVVVSEQSLPDSAEYEVRVADESAKAKLAGRDQGTNVAVLKLERNLPAALPGFAEAKVGALALVLGATTESVSARLAIVRSVGGAWESVAGGTIDRRIVLDTIIRSEEGGPVLAADGNILGISTHGIGRQALVIPASTVDKAVGVLLEKGTVERGWLGAGIASGCASGITSARRRTTCWPDGDGSCRRFSCAKARNHRGRYHPVRGWDRGEPFWPAHAAVGFRQHWEEY